MSLSAASRRQAGIILVVLPTVIYGGVSLLGLLVDPNGNYARNPLRQNLWRAGHAHAGVLLVLSLVVLRYVDEAALPAGARHFVRAAVPSAAILLPLAFFLSVLSPAAQVAGPLVYVAYPGALLLAAGLLTLGVGLLRARPG
jgi:uncharacterized membrane protein